LKKNWEATQSLRGRTLLKANEMSVEIERKFLVNKETWQQVSKPFGVLIRQGYLSTDPGRTVRVRIAGQEGFLTIKGKTQGASRSEFEYAIPYDDAKQMLDDLSVATVSKVRYKLMHEGRLWEVDEFLDDNEGLIIAEIELQDENDFFEKPYWLSEEVTTEEKYFNANLSTKPFKLWN
jgi:CYTH domain-containing protein